jgi:hypothetical protein
MSLYIWQVINIFNEEKTNIKEGALTHRSRQLLLATSFNCQKTWENAKENAGELASCHLIEFTKKHKGPGVLTTGPLKIS